MGEFSFNTFPFGPDGFGGLLSVRSVLLAFWFGLGVVLVFVWSCVGLGVVLVLCLCWSGLDIRLVLVWSRSWSGLGLGLVLISFSLSLSPSFLDTLLPSETARDRKERERYIERNQDHTREDEVPQKLRSWPFEVGQKVRGLCESIENRWVYFDGNAPHAVLPFEGQAHHLKKGVLD